MLTLLYVACVATALFVLHHQLQAVYYRTCRANLLAVVLHHRSDVCYGLNMAITTIERIYQQGVAALMHWGVSAAAIVLPCVLSLRGGGRGDQPPLARMRAEAVLVG